MALGRNRRGTFSRNFIHSTRVLLACVVAVGLAANTTSTAVAAPREEVDTAEGFVAQLSEELVNSQAEITALENEMGGLRESVNKARVDFQESQVKAHKANEEVTHARHRLVDTQTDIDQAQNKLDDLARSLYSRGGHSQAVSLVNGVDNVEDGLDRSSYLRSALLRQRSVVENLENKRTEQANEESRLRSSRQEADSLLKEAQNNLDTAESIFADSQARLAEKQSQYENLQGKSRAAQARLEAARQALRDLEEQEKAEQRQLSSFEKRQRAEEAAQAAEVSIPETSASEDSAPQNPVVENSSPESSVEGNDHHASQSEGIEPGESEHELSEESQKGGEQSTQSQEEQQEPEDKQEDSSSSLAGVVADYVTAAADSVLNVGEASAEELVTDTTAAETASAETASVDSSSTQLVSDLSDTGDSTFATSLESTGNIDSTSAETTSDTTESTSTETASDTTGSTVTGTTSGTDYQQAYSDESDVQRQAALDQLDTDGEYISGYSDANTSSDYSGTSTEASTANSADTTGYTGSSDSYTGSSYTDSTTTSSSTGTLTTDSSTGSSSSSSASEQIEAVIARAMTQVGMPYAWGGGNFHGPTKGIRDGGVADSFGDYNKIGFDCSGLMMYAFYAAGVQLQHYSGYQYTSGTQVPVEQAKRGDMLFWGAGGGQHVALYLGDGMMIEAPQSGSTVQVSPVRYSGIQPYAVRLIS